MARDEKRLFSSPDPLALSNENISVHSPAKARPTKKRASVITPRKPLVDASGNAHVQEFLLSTPARKNSNSPTKSPQNAASTSPWRIRLTVQAEQVEEERHGLRRNSSPTKRLTERATTITVPLKAGDDTPLAAAKRARGRPRKSLDSPKKRAGTPKPKMTGRRKIMWDSEEDNADNASLPTSTPPKKARGRPRKSVELATVATKSASDSLITTPVAETVDLEVAGGKTTRTRTKGRRQEITPMRLGVDLDSDSIRDTPSDAGGKPIGPERTPDGATADGQPTRAGHSRSPPLQLPERSILAQQNEIMWGSMSRSQDASPNARHEEHYEHENIDPTNDHTEYDTILESEGFSMVSVESLASAGHQSNKSFPSKSILSNDKVTPGIDPSPTEPPLFHDSGLQPLPRHVEEPRKGTPKLARVVRAGIALQGVLSPVNRDQRLGSPFDESSKASSTSSPPVSKDVSPKHRLDKLFNGFGAGTRRELRAGLRLGEELAKRQRKPAEETKSYSGVDEDVFRAATNLQYPRLPQSQTQTEYNLTIPSPLREPTESVCYPRLSKDQLPTPDRSEADADDDRMSWRIDTPAKLGDIAGSITSVSANNIERGPDESTIDYTMMAREAEWQREREAISKQIAMANKSQVIVIDSDEEDNEQVEEQEHFLDHDVGDEAEEGESDIWQAVAHSGQHSREVTPDASDVVLQSEIIKPRRSKLPSPWTRNSHIIYSDESELTAANLPQTTEHTHAKDRRGSNESSERSLDNSECSSQPDDSTGALIASQLSPPKQSRINLNETYQESSDKTDCSSQPDDSTNALIARQLSPAKDFRVKVTAASVSLPSDLVNVLPLKVSSKRQVEADSAPRTPQKQCEEESSDTSDGEMTMGSIDVQSFDKPPSPPIQEPPRKSTEHDPALIDPSLLRSRTESRKPRSKEEHEPRPPKPIQVTSPAPSSWISRLAAPIWSVLAPGPALPPPATKADILSSSPYEPLCQLTPWEPCHMRALGPLYLSSLLYGAHIFPFNPKSPAAAYVGITVTTSLGWSRTVTKRDCSVADAFMVLLHERGFALAEPGEQWIEEGLPIRMCVDIWVGMVMRGEIAVNASLGEKSGLRKQGDRLWTAEDICWKDNASEYFERKRREFDGLPSWKAMGIKWPPPV